MTVLSIPARVRSASCSPSWRTPHSSATATGFSPSSKPSRPSAVHDMAADQVALLVAGELEEPRPIARTRASWSQTTKPGRRRRVVVVHQLEQEAEAAAVARDGLVEQALAAVVVDRAALAVRADEVRHAVDRSARLWAARRVRLLRAACGLLVILARGEKTLGVERAHAAGSGRSDRLAVDVVLRRRRPRTRRGRSSRSSPAS